MWTFRGQCCCSYLIDLAVNGSDIFTDHPYKRHPFWSEIPLGRNIPGLFDNCQVVWTDGDLIGRSRNFSISRNDTKEAQEWGKQPQYYPPELNGGHQYKYPNNDDLGKFLIVNANDSMVVSWTNGSSAQATILGIKCWDRTGSPMGGMSTHPHCPFPRLNRIPCGAFALIFIESLTNALR